jgi:predicted nucleotidyltransferase component of viral defense system
MNLFDEWVEEVLEKAPELAVLRPVVEKELLHRDLLHILHQSGLLQGLVFMGGTCLRACYGSQRLSEDLDFYGGQAFRPDQLHGLADKLISGIGKKYGFSLQVQEPRQDRTQVRTWKITIQTRPQRRDLPSQRIHLDICMLDAIDARPMMLRNPYGVEAGSSGFILQAASREEIYADKVVALALRPGRIKFRDVWDLHWLRQQNVALRLPWILPKVEAHGKPKEAFLNSIQQRLDDLSSSSELQKEGWRELSRFLQHDQIKGLVDQPDFWRYISSEVRRELEPILSDSSP